MTDRILDASAVLAAILSEPVAIPVAEWFPKATLSAVNYAEVLFHTARLCGSVADAKRHLDRHSFNVIPFDTELASLTAAIILQTRTVGLSLGDCACLALGLMQQVPVYTADRAWATLELGVEIRLIR